MKPRHKEYIVFGILAIMAVMHLSCTRLPRDKIVKISSAVGMCSGEQVKAPSGVSYIMTASHCMGLADSNGNFDITTEDGKTLKRKLVAEDPESDLMLLEGLPDTEGLQIAAAVAPGDKIVTLTHGNNYATFKTEGVIIQGERVQAPVSMIFSAEDEAKCSSMAKRHPEGSYCILDVWETISTAMVVPGSSGGAVLNRSGELVGVVSAGNGTFGAFVTLSDIQKFIKNY